MIITYHGAAMVKVSYGDWVAVFNPISHQSSLKPSRFGADLALISLNHPNYNGIEEVGLGDRQPLVLNSPGEYEKDGTFISGLASLGLAGKVNTIFDLVVDDKRLVHLGALAEATLSNQVKEALLPVDILFVPVTLDRARLSPAEAYKLVLALNPGLVIPIDYTPESLKQFLKEAGEEEVKPINKLVVKGKELVGKETELVVLALPQTS